MKVNKRNNDWQTEMKAQIAKQKSENNNVGCNVEAGKKYILVKKDDIANFSDGYHTFNELYEQRTLLWAWLCNTQGGWKSRVHSDGTLWNGWFIAGIRTVAGKQMTFHCEDKYWDLFSNCDELQQAPEWDKHTVKDVLERIRLELEKLNS